MSFRYKLFRCWKLEVGLEVDGDRGVDQAVVVRLLLADGTYLPNGVDSLSMRCFLRHGGVLVCAAPMLRADEMHQTLTKN